MVKGLEEHWSDHTWVSWVQVWAPKRDMDISERVQQMTKKMMKGLEHLSYKKKMRELELVSLEKKMLGLDFTKEYKYLKEKNE
ncbi:hypothetical protein DUI87_08160 [Hirundo rustica rustica]|uniref:Uncharacterized protein n=1 Tax=Hirundo rustica rustica TaxID=333673 RepID=A0A3M0KS21_HIRRU|nr:hypothetical protein DUI87_08160 [Hirundo rustica rustica]